MDFDFKAWQRDQEVKRAARRLELQNALEDGLQISQLGHLWPDCSPFIEECNNPEYLARHIESREYSFGFQTDIIDDAADVLEEQNSNYNRMIGESLRR